MLFLIFVTLVICIIYPILIPCFILPFVLMFAISIWKDKKKIDRYKKTGNF